MIGMLLTGWVAAQATGAPLRVVATPETLVLAEGGSCTLEIEAPPGTARVDLTASAGVVEAPEPAGGGRFVARYLPPAAALPRVAIVAAVATGAFGARFGAARIPLVGLGDAVVHTRGGAEIEVRIGARTFGPARADRFGVAVVPVEVPPGVRSAWHGTREIDLGVPETERVHLVAPLRALAADAPAVVELRAWAIDRDGAPSASAPAFAATEGALGPVRALGEGAFATTLRLEPGRPREVRVRASLPSAPAAPASEVALALHPGEPARVALAGDVPTALEAGQELDLRAEALDGAGNPSTGALTFEADGAEVGAARDRDNVWRVLLFAPKVLGGVRAVTLRARAGGRAIAVATLALRPGGVDRLAIEAAADARRADPGEVVPVTVRVADRFGNPVDGPVALAAHGGAFGAPTRVEPGTFRAPLVPDLSHEPVAAEVAAEAGGVRALQRVELDGAPWRWSAAARLGLAAMPGGATAPLASLAAAWFAEPRGLPLSLELEAGWLHLAARGPGDAAAESEVALATAAVSARRALAGGVRGRVAAGAGAAFAATDVRLPGEPARGGAGVAPWGYLAASAEWARGRSAPFVELRAQGTRFDLPLLSGGYFALVGLLGYRHELL